VALRAHRRAANRAQWQAIASNNAALDQDLVQLKRTLIHETFHFYQIVCTRWLYSFVVDLQDRFRATLGSTEKATEETSSETGGGRARDAESGPARRSGSIG
jgi:hypothetical protein